MCVCLFMQSQLHVWANAKLSTFNSLLVRFTPFVCCGVYHLMKRFADNSVARRTTHMRTRAVTMALSAKKKCTICVPQRNEVFCQTKHPPPPFLHPSFSFSTTLYRKMTMSGAAPVWEWAGILLPLLFVLLSCLCATIFNTLYARPLSHPPLFNEL